MGSARSIPDQVRHLLAHGVDLVAHGRTITKVDERQQHAQQCRDLAAQMHDPEVHDQLLEMARIWESMATEQAEFITENPHFADPKDED